METSSSSIVTTCSTIEKVQRLDIYLDQPPPTKSVAEVKGVSNNKNEDANIYAKLNPENDAPLGSLLIFYPPQEETIH